MILVTGATGHFGSATIDFLLQKLPASEIAALARNAEKAVPLRARGIEVRIGDYNNYDSLVAAFTGVDKLLLISTSEFGESRVAQHINAINAAKVAGVKHITYTGADIKDPINTALDAVLDAHNATGEALKASGLPYTVLHDNLYADVLPMFLGAEVLEQGVFFPAGEGRVPFATRSDMAEAAATLLSSNEPLKAAYVFASTETHSFDDVARILSELSGKEVPYHHPDVPTYTGAMVSAGVPEAMADFLAAFGQAIAAGEFDTQRTDLPDVLGRTPTALKDYLKSVYFSKS